MDILYLEIKGYHHLSDRLLKTAQVDIYPQAGAEVNGLQVRGDIPNLDSIGSSLDEYDVLPGVREVPIADFSPPSTFFYAKNDWDRSGSLAQAIAQSGEISPLIVVIDDEGPYILEGAHRFVALAKLGKTSFPALVVLDKDDKFQDPLDSEERRGIIHEPVEASASG
jgi:hypothetical protein